MNLWGLLGLDTLVARCRIAVMETTIAVEDRWALARLEWQDQKKRLQWLVLLTLGVAGVGLVVCLMFSAALLIQFWDTAYRVQVAWAVALAWLLLWVSLLVVAARLLRDAQQGFASTQSELAKDWQSFKERL